MDSAVLATTVFALAFFLGIMAGAAWYSYRANKRFQRKEFEFLPGSSLPYLKEIQFDTKQWHAEWAMGVSTGMFGAIVTTFILGIVIVFCARIPS
jgi:hypothetical protein